jgi:hypothetical protein
MNRIATIALLLCGPLAALAGCRMGYLDIGADKSAVHGTGGAGGGTATTSTGTDGGSTSSGMPGGLCTPGATTSCYDGPAGTVGKGICQPGTQTCAPDGLSWGPCLGETLPQIENCATPLDDDCDGTAPSCTGTLQWPLRFGDAADQYLTGVAVDGGGNVLLAGYFTGTFDLGGSPLASAGSVDAFVAKLDASGHHVWSKRFGMSGASEAKAVAVDPAGNVLLTGTFTGAVDFGGAPLTSAGGADVFVVKLTASGAHAWSKRFGDAAAQSVAGIAVDGAGDAVLTGDFSGSIDFGGGALATADLDVFVAKLDPAGAHLWSKRFGDTAGQNGGGVAVDGGGNVLLAGHFSGAIDLGGGPLASGPGGDVFVARLDPGGNHLWSKHFGGTAKGIAADAGGDAVVTGVFSGAIDVGGTPLTSAGGQDVFVAKLAAAGGDSVWARRFGGASAETAAGITVDASGNPVVTGSFHGTVDFGGGPLASAGGADVFLLKLDGAGSHVWSKRFGNASGAMTDQAGTAVAATAASDVIVGGGFFGTVDFGTGPLASAGGSDIFVARFAP